VLALRAPEQPPREERVRVILHPTDFSERSEAALPVARALARHHGARLIVLYVAPQALLINGSTASAIDPNVDRARLEEVRQRVEGRDLKYPPEVRLDHGHAAAGILRAADDLDADLIVMGTHGPTGLRRLLVGNVAEAVLREAPCPVLTLKAPFREPAPAASRRPSTRATAG
jgi:nucleotide-binding universal stress UspA family protein